MTVEAGLSEQACAAPAEHRSARPSLRSGSRRAAPESTGRDQATGRDRAGHDQATGRDPGRGSAVRRPLPLRRPLPQRGDAGDATQAPAAQSGDEGALRRVARGSSFAAFGTSLGAALGFVLTIIVTRELSTHDAGIFFASIAGYYVVTTLLSFGVGAGVVRFIPRLQALGRTDDIPALLVVAILPVIVFGLAGTALAWFGAPFVARHLAGGDAGATVAVVRVLAALLLAGVLETALVESTRGFASIRSYVLIHQIFVPFARPVAVLGAVVAGAPLWGVLLAWAAPLPIAATAAGLVLRRRLRTVCGGISARRMRPAWSRLAGEYWAFTSARGVASVMDILLTWLDVLIVAAVVSPAQAAIYAAASRFITSGTLVMQSLRLALAPELSHALARNELRRTSELYLTTTQWVVLTSWPLYLAMAVFAPGILRVFGPAYPAGATALTVLCLAMLVSLAAGNVGTVLLMGGKSRWVLGDKTADVIVNVVLNLVLTTRFGITGAAIAWAVTILLDSALAFGQVRIGMRVKGSLRTLRTCAALSLGVFGLLPLLGRVALGTSVPAIATSLTVSLLLYAAVVWQLRHTLDLSVLVRALRRLPARPTMAAP